MSQWQIAVSLQISWDTIKKYWDGDYPGSIGSTAGKPPF